MLRFVGAIMAILYLSPAAAEAFTVDQMQLEFDARLLTDAEKRFLQTGLAFANVYNGMIDGAWGSGSQRALESYEVSSGRSEFVTNADVVLFALETFDIFDQYGWERQYNSGLDMSFLVPTIGFRSGGTSENLVNMELAGSSLGYSLTIGDGWQVQSLHDYTTEQGQGRAYQVRRETVWITSARTPSGVTLYTRSDYRQGFWSTIMLSANDVDAGFLAAVSGSIQPGYAPSIRLSPGVLSTGIETMAGILGVGSAETANASAGQAVAASVDQGPDSNPTDQPIAFGTGFLVSSNGDFLTNNHVVEGCSGLTIDGVPATLIAKDEAFDLALLRVSPPPPDTPAAFAEKPARLNSDVTVIGYPLIELLGGINVTRGAVTSLKGMGGDSVMIQISAPVQPGNSGGPVVNAAGQVVGVVVAKLDAQMVADAIGDIPQNINFAIRAEIAKLFLFQNGVEPVEAPEAAPLPPEDLAELAQGFTRLITCN
ncbi:MAG: trypsin-like peptidase domain-containing protein [Tabrizicola sp.]|nr:trypsin-like peptidase domain-containing protein [Tabrizicola sp.]